MRIAAASSTNVPSIGSRHRRREGPSSVRVASVGFHMIRWPLRALKPAIAAAASVEWKITRVSRETSSGSPSLNAVGPGSDISIGGESTLPPPQPTTKNDPASTSCVEFWNLVPSIRQVGAIKKPRQSNAHLSSGLQPHARPENRAFRRRRAWRYVEEYLDGEEPVHLLGVACGREARNLLKIRAEPA